MSDYIHARCGGTLTLETHHVRTWARGQGIESNLIVPSSEPESTVGRCDRCRRVGILAPPKADQ